jgi:hypothetical protein
VGERAVRQLHHARRLPRIVRGEGIRQLGQRQIERRLISLFDSMIFPSGALQCVQCAAGNLYSSFYYNASVFGLDQSHTYVVGTRARILERGKASGDGETTLHVSCGHIYIYIYIYIYMCVCVCVSIYICIYNSHII